MPDTDDKKLILTKAHLKGFKSIEDLEVELKPGLNILIGPNGSGKSNFLEFLDGAFERLNGEGIDYISILLEYAYGYETLKFSLKNEIRKSNQLNIEYLAKVVLGQTVLYNSSDPFLEISLKDDEIFHDFIERITNHKSGRIANKISVLRHLLQPLLINFNIPEEMEFVTAPGNVTISHGGARMQWSTSLGFVNDMISLIEPSVTMGELLGSGSKEMLLAKMEFSEDLIHNLSLFTPIKNLRINEGFGLFKADKGLYIDNLRIDFLVNDVWVPWSYLSDGTKRLFYIVSEVTYKKSGLILIEEPELGVHPHQFNLLMHFLQEQAVEKQIIISTHSPKALDILVPDELDRILIANYDREKGTQLRRMDAAQMLKANDYITEVGFLSDYWLMSDLEEWSELD